MLSIEDTFLKKNYSGRGGGVVVKLTPIPGRLGFRLTGINPLHLKKK